MNYKKILYYLSVAISIIANLYFLLLTITSWPRPDENTGLSGIAIIVNGLALIIPFGISVLLALPEFIESKKKIIFKFSLILLPYLISVFAFLIYIITTN